MNLKALLISKPILSLAALATVGAGAGVGAIASAQTTTSSTSATATTAVAATHGQRAPGVFGKITAISGDAITIESTAFGKDQSSSSDTTTTYTVDATNAAITVGQQGSAPTTGTISSLAVGDMIGVEGTVSGTSVTATKIMEGMGGFGMGRGGPGMGGRGTEGTVTAVSGNTITITKEDGTTSTVDASSATVSKTVTENVSDIQVGDRISADGTTSGTTVTAKHIMDGIPAPQAQATTASAATQSN